ncbi:nitrate reductase cytochrome c-type subunit [Marinomonas sp. PE14-40]|uniref:nitrate reductase cytochrome c-type subunit n=1 Tax=Marinomonas sp. PE14-40 TaxID=3060621 RepID=UPI003F66EDCD
MFKIFTQKWLTSLLGLGLISFSLIVSGVSSAQAQDVQVATMRDNILLTEEVAPPAIANVENKDLKRMRDYPQQPPTVPHIISKYQIDKNVNQCMDCHARDKASEVQATPVGVSHYLNREGEYQAGMSPRRYFCTQCHVTQTESKPLIDNEFVDVNDLMKPAANK